MDISLVNGLSRGFRKWSDSHQPDPNDDEAERGTPIPVADPPADDLAPIEEPPHHPWRIPGAGSSF